MADIFLKENAQNLLRGKNVWFFGDSNTRSMYKDLIWLLEKNTLIDPSALRRKLEKTFMYDVLIKGKLLHRGRNFQEVRMYKNFKINATIEFTFLTNCYSQNIQAKLKEVQAGKEAPDAIVINSCLWDITRWGPESVEKYKVNVIHLLKLLKSSLPSSTRVIWTTTPPISNDPRGGFFIKQIEFLKHTLRFDVMEANAFVSRAVITHGFDVLDIHYHLLLQIHRRQPDGIHWNPEAIRHITNLILTHLSATWAVPLPGNFKSSLLPYIFKIEDLSSQCVQQSRFLQNLNNLPINKTKIPPPRKNKNKRKKLKSRGAKRDYNGNPVDAKSDLDFTENVFDYDYTNKKFKI